MKIVEDLLTPNKFSRPQTKIKPVQGIVVHWVANPKTSAKANRNFFEMRKDGNKGYGSAHYIINLDGDIIIDIPEDEMAYHVGAQKYKKEAVKTLGSYPNNCTIGIECTHLDRNGKMSDETYDSLVELSADLIKRYSLDPMKDLYRHFDITGKDCHKWFVDNPDKWDEFKKNVDEKIKGLVASTFSLDKNNETTVLNEEILNVFKKYFKENPDVWDNFKQSVEA